jgi:hypothetical protein
MREGKSESESERESEGEREREGTNVVGMFLWAAEPKGTGFQGDCHCEEPNGRRGNPVRQER